MVAVYIHPSNECRFKYCWKPSEDRLVKPSKLLFFFFFFFFLHLHQKGWYAPGGPIPMGMIVR